MTNGEMIQRVYCCEVCEPIPEDDIIHVIFSDKNNSAIGFDWSWWNMEYKEQNTKIFADDCISRDVVKKYIQAHIHEIITESGEDKNKHTNRILRLMIHGVNCMPSVTPQEPRWIPVGERLPEDLKPVNITWVNHDPVSYYADIKDKPLTATGVYFNGQWYWWSTVCVCTLAEYGHNYEDIIDEDIEITAWMPLPKSYSGVKK